MPYSLHSLWRKSAIMPIWSFQLALLSIDLMVSILILPIISNTPDQTITVGGKDITLVSSTQKYVLPRHHPSTTPLPLHPAPQISLTVVRETMS